MTEFLDLENKGSVTPVARVSICLDENHDKCRGAYVDVTRAYAILCACPCHKKSQSTCYDLSSAGKTSSISHQIKEAPES